ARLVAQRGEGGSRRAGRRLRPAQVEPGAGLMRLLQLGQRGDSLARRVGAGLRLGGEGGQVARDERARGAPTLIGRPRLPVRGRRAWGVRSAAPWSWSAWSRSAAMSWARAVRPRSRYNCSDWLKRSRAAANCPALYRSRAGVRS